MDDLHKKKIDELDALAIRYLERGAFDDVFFIYERLASLDSSNIKRREAATVARTLAVMSDEIKRKESLQPGVAEARLQTLRQIEEAWPSMVGTPGFLRLRVTYTRALEGSDRSPSSVAADVERPQERRPAETALGALTNGTAIAYRFDRMVDQGINFLARQWPWRIVLSEWPVLLSLGLFLVLASSQLSQPFDWPEAWPETPIFSWMAAYHRFTLLKVMPEGDLLMPQPPLYTWLLGGVLWVFGISDLVVKVFVGALGSLTIIACYGLFRRISNRLVATLATLLIAGNPLTLMYFVVGAPYESLLLPLYAASLMFASGADSSRSRVLALASYILALFTKTHAIVLIPSLLWLFWRRVRITRTRWVWLSLIIISPALIYIGWELFAQAAGAQGPFTYGYEKIYLGRLWVGSYWGGILSGHTVFTKPMLALAALGIAVEGRRNVAMVLWLLSTVALDILAGVASAHIIVALELPPVAYFAALSVGWSVQAIMRMYAGIRAWQSTTRPLSWTARQWLRVPTTLMTILVVLSVAAASVQTPPELARQMKATLAADQATGVAKEAAAWLAPRLGPDERILVAWEQSAEHYLAWYLAQADPRHLRPLFKVYRVSGRPAPPDLKFEDLSGTNFRYIVVATAREAYARAGIDPVEQARVSASTQNTFAPVASFGSAWKVTIYDARRTLSDQEPVRLWAAPVDRQDAWLPNTKSVTLSLDKETLRDGQASLRVSVKAPQKESYTADLLLDPPVDWSEAQSLSFWLKADTPSSAAEIAYVALFSGARDSAIYVINFPAESWTHVSVPLWQGPTWDFNLDLHQVKRLAIGLTPRENSAPINLWIQGVEVTTWTCPVEP